MSHADQLLLGDAQELIQALPSNEIQLVYIDPPFGTGASKRSVNRISGQMAHFQDNLTDPQKFVEWLRPLLEQTRRVLTDDGNLVVHLDYRTIHYIKVALDSVFGRHCFNNEIIWCYASGGRNKKTFGRKHDTLLWYSKTKDYFFNPDAVRIPRKAGSHMKVVEIEPGVLVQEKTDRKTGKVYHYPLRQGKVPEDWWTDIPTLNHSAKERVGWPTQKPEKLLNRIVSGLSQEGALVGDWFSGSGTTAVVCRKLNRRFIAFDQQAQAIELAQKRLQELPMGKHDIAVDASSSVNNS